MKLVEHCGNIGWKVHELAWNLCEIDFCTSMKSFYQNSIIGYAILMT